MSETNRIARAYREMEERGGQRWSLANAGNRRILWERRTRFRELLDSAGFLPLANTDVLEVGCGTGAELAWMLELGGSPEHLVGVDLLADRVATARRSYPGLDFQHANAEHLESASESFDLVLGITIFSSILDRAMAKAVASEINRVLRPGGGLLWYDVRYDSVSNRSVKAVSSKRIRELFPDLEGKLATITVLPPLARRLGALTSVAYPMLSLVPPLRSHLYGLLRKGSR